MAAALALSFLIFAITTVSMARVASIYAGAAGSHNKASALFLAEAGIRQAAHSLMKDQSYTGEKGTRLPTGCFDVSVAPGQGGFAVTSTGYVDSPMKRHPRKTVRATVSVSGRSFRISDWRTNQ